MIVCKGEYKLRELRIDELEQLVLMGNVSLTPQAMKLLLHRRIDTVLMTMTGLFQGRLTAGFAKNVPLRVLQHKKLSDESYVLDMAKRYVRAKINNQRRILQRAQWTKPNEEIAKMLVSMRICLERIEKTSSLDELRGFEGKAASDYFSVFGKLIKAPGIVFTRRIRRPPPDPVNVLLSFGYTVLTNLVSGLCEAAGFDPFVGALHAVEYGRPSLPLDLIEEFRALIVDTAVVRAVNRKQITMAHFIAPSSPEAEVEESWTQDQAQEVPDRARVVFRREGVMAWVTALEHRLNEETVYIPRREKLSYRQIIREQVYRLGRHIEGRETYEGFEGP